jgi:tetratricopeptide (TPR) repeat protein
MDTFERLDPNAGDGSSERAFQDLCSRLINAPGDLAGRSAMLLFGRERLRWERYDESRTEPWSEYIRTQELTGFTKTDATAFLHNEYSEFWKRRGVGEIPNMLRKYEPQILEAAEERHGRPGAPTFLPYSLRLAGEMIYVQGDRFAPEMLGQSPEELQRRFLKYLKERYPEKIRAMRVLALALYFDDDLFRYLVRHHLIQGIPIQGFVSELMRDHCYVRRFEDAGKISYRFHRHMQQSLLDGLQREQEDVDAAVEAIDAILDYYSARATFANAHEFVSEIHVPPFEHGMDVLLTHTERGWIHPDRAREWLDRFDRPFDCGDFRIGAVAKMQLLDRVLPLWEKLFGSGSEETADILNHLAILFYGQQRYQEAKSLYERALAIYEKTLPPNNASTATVLRNLAVLYVDEDRPAKALPMLERALEIYEKTFGPEHPNTAGILDSLGVLWAKEWDFLRAREFFERALDIFEKTLEPDNPNIAATRYNISNLTRMEDLFFEE